MSWNKLVSEVQSHNRYLIEEIKEKNTEISKLYKEIERLQVVEQAYDAMKKSL